MAAKREAVERHGRQLSLSNPDKVLYPATGFTKGQVIDYYDAIGEVLVPHLRGRPTTLKRYPDGVDGQSFFEKNCAKHRPEWVEVIPTWAATSKREVSYCRLDEPAALVWTAQIAALELHPGLARHDDLARPTHVVFDLDPGLPADALTCVAVAVAIRRHLDDAGLASFPKTSGSKGLQVLVPLNGPVTFDDTRAFALSTSQAVAADLPDLVLTDMKRDLRDGKVLIDWSQNNPTKTTISVWSLRARERPWVSTPVEWDELEAAVAADDLERLRFEAPAALDRARAGDLAVEVQTRVQALPT